MRKVDRLGWAASSLFRVGQYHIGVRSNTAEVDRALQELLSAHLVRGASAPRNYSVQVNAADAGTFRFHLLFSACTPVVRARHARSLVDELLRRLDEHGSAADGSVLRVEAAAFVCDGQAVLVPTWVARDAVACARLRRRGLVAVPGSLIDLELGTGRLLVRPPSLDVDPDALRSWSARLGTAPEPTETASPGRYPLAAWVFTDGTGDEVITSKAVALSRALRTVRNGRAVTPPQALATLAATLRDARLAVLPRAEDDVAGFVGHIVGH